MLFKRSVKARVKFRFFLPAKSMLLFAELLVGQAATIIALSTSSLAQTSSAFRVSFDFEKGSFDISTRLRPFDIFAPDLTAVYDIKAHVVTMPDGARLEAHSGLGDRADEPRFVRERMRGPTPPALYELVLLKQPFHGITTLRLNPIAGQIFGRTDLLAHTYMLHGRPESFGCVVFRDYATFLKAFQLGRVKRLRVVPAVGDASLRSA